MKIYSLTKIVKLCTLFWEKQQHPTNNIENVILYFLELLYDEIWLQNKFHDFWSCILFIMHFWIYKMNIFTYIHKNVWGGQKHKNKLYHWYIHACRCLEWNIIVCWWVNLKNRTITETKRAKQRKYQKYENTEILWSQQLINVKNRLENKFYNFSKKNVITTNFWMFNGIKIQKFV